MTFFFNATFSPNFQIKCAKTSANLFHHLLFLSFSFLHQLLLLLLHLLGDHNFAALCLDIFGKNKHDTTGQIEETRSCIGRRDSQYSIQMKQEETLMRAEAARIRGEAPHSLTFSLHGGAARLLRFIRFGTVRGSTAGFLLGAARTSNHH